MNYSDDDFIRLKKAYDEMIQEIVKQMKETASENEREDAGTEKIKLSLDETD